MAELHVSKPLRVITWLLVHRWQVLGPVVMTVLVLIVLALASHCAGPLPMDTLDFE